MSHHDDQIKKFLKDVRGAVEATSYEELRICQEYKQEYSWEQNLCGYLETVGFLGKMPICISLRTSVVNGHKILFWDATSQVVDHKKIDKWFKKNLPESARRDDGSPNRTDAMNFHNILPRDEP
jgi:hypothetical protein